MKKQKRKVEQNNVIGPGLALGKAYKKIQQFKVMQYSMERYQLLHACISNS